jgi:hypothetical protein
MSIPQPPISAAAGSGTGTTLMRMRACGPESSSVQVLPGKFAHEFPSAHPGAMTWLVVFWKE